MTGDDPQDFRLRFEADRHHLVPIRRAAVALHYQIFTLTSIFALTSILRISGLKMPDAALKWQTEPRVSRLGDLRGPFQ